MKRRFLRLYRPLAERLGVREALESTRPINADIQLHQPEFREEVGAYPNASRLPESQGDPLIPSRRWN